MPANLVTAAAAAATKKVVKQTTLQAVKAAAPAIAKAALSSAAAAASSTAVKTAMTRKPTLKPTRTKRNTRKIAPVAYTTSFAKSGKTVRIAQSEIIADISPEATKDHWWSQKTATDFSVRPFELSPSNETTFPWLSKVAGLFDKFHFRKLTFTFVSTRPTNTKGNIAMGIDYDSYDKLPENIVDMSNLAKFTTSPVYVNQTLAIPTNHPGSRSWYYCADGSGGDKKTYNIGNFYIALAGAEDIKSHGYLIVDYDVELCDKNPYSTTVKTVLDKPKATIHTLLTSYTGTFTPPSGDSVPIVGDTKYYFYDRGTTLNTEYTGTDDNWFHYSNDGTVEASGLTVGSKIMVNFYFTSPVGYLDVLTYNYSPPTIEGLDVDFYYTHGRETSAEHVMFATVTSANFSYNCGIKYPSGGSGDQVWYTLTAFTTPSQTTD